MPNLRLTQDELDIIDQGLYEYIDATVSATENAGTEGVHFTSQVVINATTRCFTVSMIIDIFSDGDTSFWIVDVSEASFDEYLDAYNDTFNQK